MSCPKCGCWDCFAETVEECAHLSGWYVMGAFALVLGLFALAWWLV